MNISGEGVTGDIPLDLVEDASLAGIKIINTNNATPVTVTLKSKTTPAQGSATSTTIIVMNKVVIPVGAFLVLNEMELGVDTQFFTLFITLGAATDSVSLTLYF